MSAVDLIVGALVCGMALGAVFYGGLWLTVGPALRSATPGIWFGLSALMRMGVVVVGLYGCARLGLPSLSACLCGVLLARGAVNRRTRPAG